MSSLGAGGTNAHVVLEEAPPAAPAEKLASSNCCCCRARSSDALDRAAEMLRAHLAAEPDISLADAAYTLQVGRRRFDHRHAIVATSPQDAIALLESSEPARVASATDDTQRSPVTFLFPGQGAQRVNMGRGLYETEPVFRSQIDECSELLRAHLDKDLRSILYPRDEDAAAAQAELTQTEVTQPALFVISYALAKLWEHWGIAPDAMIGHSLGEYVAASIAGVFSRDDALTLVARRASLMQEVPSGAMLAVRATASEISSFLVPSVSIAGFNSPKLTVISGDHQSISSVEAALESRGIAAKRLATSHAFHSSMMDPIVERFAEMVRHVPLSAPQTPFVSSVTGDWITDADATDASYWARQLREPVRFADGAGRLLADAGRVFLEVGPGSTLTTLVRQQLNAEAARATVASLSRTGDGSPDIQSMLMAAGRLWMAGANLDWDGLHGHVRRQRVRLPTYPFERKRYWVDPVVTAAGEVDLRPPVPEATPVDGREVEKHMNESMLAEAVPTSAPRTDVTARLQALFSELSGLQESELDASVSFLELGLDSLFLTQASTAIHKTFGVKVAFRDLLEDASTLAAVAARIEAELPPEAASPVPPVTPQAATASSADAAATATDPLEHLAAQMEVMARQLEMLRGQGAAQPPPPPPAVATPAPSPATTLPRTSETPAESGTIAFGPYRPPARGASGGLTPVQEQALASLVERYEKRTAGSKRFTAENRPHLADPRSVAGFRSLWKEMVYPIVSTRSSGAHLWDVDGNEYVDITNGFGIDLLRPQPAVHPRRRRSAVRRRLRDRSADAARGRSVAAASARWSAWSAPRSATPVPKP